MQNRHKQLLAMLECAVMVALAMVLDLLPLPKWPNGGSLSVAAVPIFFISCRHGWKWGIGTGFVNGVIQLLCGWYAPPAGTAVAVFGCVLLDYLLAFSALGTASVFARLLPRRPLVGYGLGAVCASLLRFVCSFLSGWLLFGVYAPEGVPVWLYSLGYNAGYMLPNAILCGVIFVLLCTLVDPKTLRPTHRQRKV